MPMMLDYSIYLVTGSTMVSELSTVLSKVKQAIENGVTMVQLREKDILTREFVDRARKVLEVTRVHKIPLIINDRIDVALAVHAEGVHVGQEDMPATVARRLIGPDKILGVSCSSEAETSQVCVEGVADYVGLGTLYATSTKKTKSVIGPIGIRKLLHILRQHNDTHERKIACVAIGGINQENVSKVRYQCQIPGQSIDGVAVVSCIMGAANVPEAMLKLANNYHDLFPYNHDENSGNIALFSAKPLVHHITNNVVKNFSANVTLAVGGSPIMSELPKEFNEFASLDIPASLVVNLGTPTPDLMAVCTAGLQTYNKHRKPVVFDPVAAGASSARLEACRTLLNAGQFTVIKGNLGEIMALYKLTLTETETANMDTGAIMQGVDSTVKLSNDKQIIKIALRVSQEFRAVVVVTGVKNYVVDFIGSEKLSSIATVDGGSPIMESVTGTGCALGSSIGCYVACATHDNLDIWGSVVAAVTFYNKAGLKAGPDCDGPGSFTVKFLDSLHSLARARENDL